MSEGTALCRPCREDRYQDHRGTDSAPTQRKGLNTGSHVIKCTCVCQQPDNWRDPLPREGIEIPKRTATLLASERKP